jgi:predicted dehydrogenase
LEREMLCGVVGAGNWMRSALLPALLAQKECKVVGCAAADAAEAGAFAQEMGIPRAFSSLDAMISEGGKLDLVVLATPDHAHASGIAAALNAGIAVYCEKPLANDPQTARELVDLARKTSVPATVGFSFRFNPALQALQRDLRAGRLGEPWLIELSEHNPQFHPAGGKPLNWKGDPAMARGGALFEYGSHVIDLANWLLGPIARVSARFQKILPNARLDDIATLLFEFRSGATGTLVASWLLDGGFPGIRVRLHGSKALAEVWVDDRLPGGQRYQVTPTLDQTPADQPVAAMGADYRSDAASRHIGDFVARVQGRRPEHGATLPSLEDGAHVQSVMEAALNATAEWVHVS